MEIPQNKALELIGAQQIEITILREALALARQHRCEPCSDSCCNAQDAAEEAE